MKCSSKTLQNLLYFMYKKTHVVFFRFSFRAILYFCIMNALVYVNIDQGIHKDIFQKFQVEITLFVLNLSTVVPL